MAVTARSSRFSGDHEPSLVWDPHDLIRRLSLALSIARRALALLAADGYRDAEAPEESFGPDKPFAETAMLLHVASAVREPAAIAETVAELAQTLAALARTDRTACAVAMHPSIALQLAMPHVLLNRLGLADARFDRLLTLSQRAQAHSGREVVPHRTLERLWLETLWTGEVSAAEVDAAAARSVLNHPLDLIWGARDDAYAHTHTFMYFTDFGYTPRPLPRSPDVILGESAAVLARAFLLEDYDLAAEVLMAWPMTRAPWPAAGAFGFRVLAELEDRVGFLPAKNGTPEKFARLTGSERTKYALAASYHTAYVMGMLCALSLRPGSTPPAAINGSLVPRELIDVLLIAIPQADTPWRVTFDGLQPAEQQALGPFLLDVALLSRARSNDFGAVGQLLALAFQHGLADRPLCSQAAELLHRMAACADTDRQS